MVEGSKAFVVAAELDEPVPQDAVCGLGVRVDSNCAPCKVDGLLETVARGRDSGEASHGEIAVAAKAEAPAKSRLGAAVIRGVCSFAGPLLVREA